MTTAIIIFLCVGSIAIAVVIRLIAVVSALTHFEDDLERMDWAEGLEVDEKGEVIK